jgi:hypothetical protein
MPSSAIDPSQVQWDPPAAASAPTAIDPSKVQWDPPAANQTMGDAVQAPAPPETGARVGGLTDRALLLGIGHLYDTPGAIAALADRAGGTIHDWTRGLFGLKPDAEPPIAAPTTGADIMTRGADTFGLPTPATTGERIGSAAVSALPSAVLAPGSPILGPISAAAGGAASQATAEAGGSPLQQTLAGLAVGSVPAVASGVAQGARALVRNAGDTSARIADAAASDVPLTAGQATGSRTVQAIEGASSKLWGGGPIKATAEKQSDALGNRVGGIVDNLAAGGDVSPTGAGAAINAGATKTAANMRAAEQAAYDKVDSLVPPDTKISVQNTLSKLDELASPTPGAGSTTGALVSSKIAAMRKNLAADAATSDGQLLAIPGDGQLPYDAVKQLRSAVGANIDHGFAPADPATNAAFKQVYGALSSDMEAGASAVSPEAKQAAADASSLYKVNSAKREFLDTVVNKNGGPEAVYQAATNGTKQGATKIGGVMSALDPGQQNLVRATVLDRLGKAVPSAQNAAGDTFNPSTYLTNWAKLDPAAKDALFGASGAPNSLRAGLDSLSNTMSTIRNSTVFKNPSGTGEAIGHGAGLFAILEGGGAALAGHPGHLAAVGGGIAANAVLARALTNPKTVAWLAQTAKLPTSALPNAVNQLGKINDPDAKDLAATLSQ